MYINLKFQNQFLRKLRKKNSWPSRRNVECGTRAASTVKTDPEAGTGSTWSNTWHSRDLKNNFWTSTTFTPSTKRKSKIIFSNSIMSVYLAGAWTTLVQWGSEYWPFEYRKHLNTRLFEARISNGLVFKWSFHYYALCTRLTIWIPDQYIRKQNGFHLSGIQMVGRSVIQMSFIFWSRESSKTLSVLPVTKKEGKGKRKWTISPWMINERANLCL